MLPGRGDVLPSFHVCISQVAFPSTHIHSLLTMPIYVYQKGHLCVYISFLACLLSWCSVAIVWSCQLLDRLCPFVGQYGWWQTSLGREDITFVHGYSSLSSIAWALSSCVFMVHFPNWWLCQLTSGGFASH